MTKAPRLLSLSTAVPPFVLDQESVRERARRLFAGHGLEIDRLLPVYANAGIRHRYSCVPLEWYGKNIGWRERNRLYCDHALLLLEKAARDALAQAGLDPADIDAVVTVSTTGISTPTLDAHLLNRLGFRPDVERLPIFGLGCAGGVLGLNRAVTLAAAKPPRHVLLLVVELCALTFRPGDTSKSNIIATALFGDGAAGAVVSTAEDDDGPALGPGGEYTWPNSLDVMGWEVEDDGLGVLFSRDIPRLIETDYATALESFLSAAGLVRSDMDGFLCHPGGAKVLSALERLHKLQAGGMRHARSVLRDYGNMSAATVLFVLHRALASGVRGRQLLSALGPGFTAGFALIEV